MHRAMRNKNFRLLRPVLAAVLLACTPVVGMATSPDQRDGRNTRALARQILNATGVRGGLIVDLGCGDGRLTAALHRGDRYLVHGLDANPAHVRAARALIRSLGTHGAVSVDQCRGKRLPYVDNLVNLIVVEDASGIPRAEWMRVLCPGGTAYVKQGRDWTGTVKPWPADIDQWTHFLHDATNNAVARDTVVGPPNQLQWVGRPWWARSHDHLASVSAVVSSAGRLFSIVDEGPIAAVVLDSQWQLVARDAFNGVVLWKRAITRWQWHLRGFRSGPSDLARRLVAVGDRVFTTLELDGPVTALDAATGRIETTYKATNGARELVWDQGILYVVAGRPGARATTAETAAHRRRRGLTPVRSQRPAYQESVPPDCLLALDAASGRLLWKKCDADTSELMPTTLAISQQRVFFENADQLICLDTKSGNPVWRADRATSHHRPSWSAPTLVVFGDVVLSADRAAMTEKKRSTDEDAKVEWMVTSMGGRAPVGKLVAFSAKDGRRLWSCKSREGYNSPVDVLVSDGLVWTGNVVRARDPGFTEGRDPHTGKVRRTRPKDQTFFTPGMGHGRCYRNKATSRYLVVGRSGVEFIDVVSGVAVPNHWTRGTCQYGVMPCNGLLYAPPHSCACFTASKLNGFNCLAPKRPSQVAVPAAANRLEHGPAYSDQADLPRDVERAKGDDWPTYRHDPARSGHASTPVAAHLQRTWQTNVGGKLSSVVVAAGRLFVAQIDAHTVHALDVHDGRVLWRYTAGGRVDSPPTVWRGQVLFGSADGWVYCLRACDGTLIWRFLAAPKDQRIVAADQLESAWPVPGSVLVQNGTVYCVAGRSSYLEGGIRLVRLDAHSGRLLSETIIDDRDPKTGYQRRGVVHGTSMPGALPDVLSCAQASIFMRHTRFDLDGRRQDPTVPHLFSGTGLLDDTWWHRTYWLVGTKMETNYGGWPRVGNRAPAGRLLVLDKATVYGFGRNRYNHCGAHIGIDAATIFHFNPKHDAPWRTTYYQVFASDRRPPAAGQAGFRVNRRGRRVPAPPKRYRWTQKLPVLARAMVLAGNHLLLAGPPDIFQVDDPVAAIDGNKGGLLYVLSTEDGRQLARYPLASPPVFDGMAAAGGRLYLATMHGKVQCWAHAMEIALIHP